MERKLTDKGEATREKLLAAAREQFYEQGYSQTSLKDITARVGLQPGQVTYHFKTKDSFVRILYQDMYDKIDERINNSGLKINNALLFHFVRVRILYRILLYDENTRRFFTEIAGSIGQIRVNGAIVKKQYYKIIEEMKLTISDDQFRMIQQYESAGRRMFFKDYVDGKYPSLSLDTVLTIIEKIVPMTLNIDQGFVNTMLLESIGIAESIGIGDIRFLI